MLPTARDPMSQALVGLAPLRERDAGARLRVGLEDGSVADGLLLSASADHLSLRLPGAQARHIPAEQIRSVHLAHPHRAREWAVAGAGILLATAGLAGLTALPGIGTYLRGHAQTAFGMVFYAGAGLLLLLLARTGLRDWLTRWETLVDVRGQAPVAR